MGIDLSGKSALVTGGNRGIGLAAVEALAKAGAKVTFTGRDEAKVGEAMAALAGVGDITGAICDVTDREALAAVMAPGFDILVNNAGIVAPIGRLDEISVEDFASNLNTNLVSAFHAAQLAIKTMTPAGGGTIVNLSSGAARRPLEGWGAYCAGKAGLAMLTRSIHEEFAEHGIRVFGFAPGVVDTDMQVAIRASGINPVSQLKRSDLASPHEPALAIAWLCTPAADPLCGQEVDVRDAALREACGLEPIT